MEIAYTGRHVQIRMVIRKSGLTTIVRYALRSRHSSLEKTVWWFNGLCYLGRAEDDLQPKLEVNSEAIALSPACLLITRGRSLHLLAFPAFSTSKSVPTSPGCTPASGRSGRRSSTATSASLRADSRHLDGSAADGPSGGISSELVDICRPDPPRRRLAGVGEREEGGKLLALLRA